MWQVRVDQPGVLQWAANVNSKKENDKYQILVMILKAAA
jgi:hypothetical protein